MLLNGATLEQMAKGAKTTTATAYMHLNQLRIVHKRAVVKKDGAFRYDMNRMNGKRKAKGKNSKG